MANIVEGKDPRGVKVYCTENQWNSHVVLNHENMTGNEAAILATITSPLSIYESHDSDPPLDYREIYCKETPMATYYSIGMHYTKVVVSSLGGSAEIVTAYPAKKEEGGTIGEFKYHE